MIEFDEITAALDWRDIAYSYKDILGNVLTACLLSTDEDMKLMAQRVLSHLEEENE